MEPVVAFSRQNMSGGLRSSRDELPVIYYDTLPVSFFVLRLISRITVIPSLREELYRRKVGHVGVVN